MIRYNNGRYNNGNNGNNDDKELNDYSESVGKSHENSDVVINIKELKRKSPEELQAQAEELHIENISAMLKQDGLYSTNV